MMQFKWELREWCCFLTSPIKIVFIVGSRPAVNFSHDSNLPIRAGLHDGGSMICNDNSTMHHTKGLLHYCSEHACKDTQSIIYFDLKQEWEELAELRNEQVLFTGCIKVVQYNTSYYLYERALSE